MDTSISSVILYFVTLLLSSDLRGSHLYTVSYAATIPTAGPDAECVGGYTYTKQSDRNANGASLANSANSVAECKAECSTESACKSFDFNPSNLECWIHEQTVNVNYRPGVDHYTKGSACSSTTPIPSSSPVPSTIASSTPLTPVTGAVNPEDCVSGSEYTKYVGYFSYGGTNANKNTLSSCTTACTAQSATACYGFDFNSNDNTCWTFSSSPSRQSGSSDVTHYVRSSCTVSSTIPPSTLPTGSTLPPTTTIPTTVTTRIPSRNLPASFQATYSNNFNSTIKNKTAFIDTYRTKLCDWLSIRCERLTKPATEDDLKEGSIVVDGYMEPAQDSTETDTQDLMEKMKDEYSSFRPDLGPENSNQRLRPVTGGFEWERVYSSPAPTESSDDGNLIGPLKLEYVVLIALGAVAIIILIIALCVICCLRKKGSDSSDKKEEKKRQQAEAKEQKKREKQEAKEKKKKEKEEKKAAKKDKDVEKAEDNKSEPDVVPSQTDDPGLSDDDKAY